VLEKGLNIVRWRGDPEMDDERLKRLVDEAIRESREAAATGRLLLGARAGADRFLGRAVVVRLRVEPGERTRVTEVDIRFTGPGATDGEARPYRERARRTGPAAGTAVSPGRMGVGQAPGGAGPRTFRYAAATSPRASTHRSRNARASLHLEIGEAGRRFASASCASPVRGATTMR